MEAAYRTAKASLCALQLKLEVLAAPVVANAPPPPPAPGAHTRTAWGCMGRHWRFITANLVDVQGDPRTVHVNQLLDSFECQLSQPSVFLCWLAGDKKAAAAAAAGGGVDPGLAALQPLLAELGPKMKLTALLEAVQVEDRSGQGV